MQEKDSWQTKHFVLAGMIAALTFALAFGLGIGIISATGIPATGSIANIFVCVMVVVIGAHLAPRFGFGTLTMALVFTFAIPTVIGGPPGVYKVVNGAVIGLIYDCFLLLGKRRAWSHVVGGGAGGAASIALVYASLLLYGLPGIEKLQGLVVPLTGAMFVVGALGALTGVALFQRRLKHLGAVQRLLGQPGGPD